MIVFKLKSVIIKSVPARVEVTRLYFCAPEFKFNIHYMALTL